MVATNTAARIPAHWPATADQSAPVIERRVHGRHDWNESNGPSSSQ